MEHILMCIPINKLKAYQISGEHPVSNIVAYSGYSGIRIPVTEDVSGRTIALPFFNNLKEEQVDYVVEKLKCGLQAQGKNSI